MSETETTRATSATGTRVERRAGFDDRDGGDRRAESRDGDRRVRDRRQSSDRPRQDVGGDSTSFVGAGAERYLTFALAGEVYALPILDITEIMEYRALTVVPMMPSFLRGVINLRGRVVPVVDMAARFGRGHTEVARRTSIIIVEIPDRTGEGTSTHMGIMVDAVNKVVHLGAEDIEPPPAFGAGIRADFISGMARYDTHFVIVLDASRVLSVDEMTVIGQVADPADGEADA
jgi:purine-binding chemotaxis protein CheW